MSNTGRRAYDRVDYETPVTVYVKDRSFSGACQNVSQGGMFIETEESLDMGEQVRVTFHLPGVDKDVETGAHLRWIERNGAVQLGIGIQFDGLRAIEVWAINQLFRRRSKE